MKNNSTDLKQSLKNIVTISKKELRAFFDNPTAYIVLIVFLLLWEFLFFRGAFLIGEASIRSLFDFLLWLYLILIPAITMGTIAQERKDGTLEFMLTRPIREYELIIGKFVGNVIFVAIALLFIFPIAYSFSQFGELDWGVVWGQYLGSLLAAAVLVALGIFVSSLVSSQISAMLIIAVSGFMLTILGYDFFLNRFPLSWAQIFEQLSLSTHFQSTIRGIVDLRDMLYYFTLILTFLSFSFLAFLKRKIGKLKKDNNQVFGVALVVGIAILLNILIVNNPKRWDLTQNKS